MAAASAVPTAGCDAAGPAGGRFCVVGYLPEYRMGDIRESWAKQLTHIIYFSIEPKASGQLDTSKLKTDALKKLQTLVKRSNVRMLISLGGWGRSKNFAPMATDTDARRKFVSNLTAFCRKHRLAGADFDWEFPKGPKQEQAYAALLVETKKAFGPHGMLVTVAVGHNKRLAADAYKAVDYIHLMSYDHGVRHATFADSIADVKRQLAFGAARNKLCLGTPFYGRNMKNRNDARTYSDIVKAHKPAPGADEAGGVYFNGVNTIRKKTQWAIDNGLAGVMIWELGPDTPGDTSLRNAIHRTVQKAAPQPGKKPTAQPPTDDRRKKSPTAAVKRVLKDPKSKNPPSADPDKPRKQLEQSKK